MKVVIKNKKIPVEKALKLALLANGEGLYYSHMDLTCSQCEWGVELHRNVTGHPAHFEHKNGNPKPCDGPY